MADQDCQAVNPEYHPGCRARGALRLDVTTGRYLVVCDECLCVATAADTWLAVEKSDKPGKERMVRGAEAVFALGGVVTGEGGVQPPLVPSA